MDFFELGPPQEWRLWIEPNTALGSIQRLYPKNDPVYVHLHLHMHLHLHLPTSALRLHLGLDLYRPTFTFGHTYSSIFKFETRSRSEAKLSYCSMWWEAGGNDAIRHGRAAGRF